MNNNTLPVYLLSTAMFVGLLGLLFFLFHDAGEYLTEETNQIVRLEKDAVDNIVESVPEVSMKVKNAGDRNRFTLEIIITDESLSKFAKEEYLIQLKENSTIKPASKLSEAGFTLDMSSDNQIRLFREYEFSGRDYWDFSAVVINKDGLASQEKSISYENPFREKITDYIDKHSVKGIGSPGLSRKNVVISLKKGSPKDIVIDEYNFKMLHNNRKLTVIVDSGEAHLKIKLKSERQWTKFLIN